MTPEQLAVTIDAALRDILAGDVSEGDPQQLLGSCDQRVAADLPPVVVRRPARREHGDWATAIALRVAAPAGRRPRELAAELAERLGATAGIATATVAGPGFVNVTLDTAAAGELARTIVTAGSAYGRVVDEGSLVDEGSQLAEHVSGREAVAVPEAASVAITTLEPAGARHVEALAGVIGRDAAGFALLRAEAESSVDADPARWAARDLHNPLFAVQSAHARAHVAAEVAAAAGVRREDAFVPELLDAAEDSALLAALADYPQAVSQATARREPRRVTTLLEEVAVAYHRWRDLHPIRPPGDAPITDAHRTRLWLDAATRQVLGSGLALLGVSAPQRI